MSWRFLDRRGIDYLFVASVPPNKAKSDEVYRYPWTSRVSEERREGKDRKRP